ncbi:alpha/beta fold hydrolase [Lysinibacillus sp. NPDC086135]|uniref:alpha/beta fold hydrolase n=1 Tax=Lysinibacillus sp. NPDC086135 TaxID=3364130 RepID=UPI0037F4A1F6
MYSKIQYSKLYSTANIFRTGRSDCCILFVHGFSESSICWEDVSTKIKGHVNLVTYDCIGHGNNASLWKQASFESYTDQLDELINYLLEYEKFTKIILVGHSQGASIAMQYSMKNPNKVYKLILVSPITYIDNALESLWNNFIKLVEKGQIERFWDINSSLLLGPKSKEWSHFRGNAIQKRLEFFSQEHLLSLMKALLDINIEKDLSILSNKITHLIHGEYDAMFPNYYSKSILKYLPNAEYIEVAGANHLLIELEPHISRALMEFVNDLSTSSL